MKKIMFNDKYGLTEAVLNRSKTQTRRIITCPKTHKGQHVSGFQICKRNDGSIVDCPELLDDDERWFDDGACILPMYKLGEVIAVAQRYRDIAEEQDDAQSVLDLYSVGGKLLTMEEMGIGWSNKMFVKSDLMPHQIEIANIRIQKLQDISDKDCLAEGVELNTRQFEYSGEKLYCVKGLGHWRSIGCDNFNTPQEAYAALIDKVSGKGTWEGNPYVFVYDFKLIK